MSEDTSAPKTAREELEDLERQEAEEARVAKQGKAEEEARTELANRKILRELRAKNPGKDLFRINTIAGMVVVRRVTAEQYAHFQRSGLDPNERQRAYTVLTAAGVIHPDPDGWEEMYTEYPALLGAISDRVMEASGHDTTVKKV